MVRCRKNANPLLRRSVRANRRRINFHENFPSINSRHAFCEISCCASRWLSKKCKRGQYEKIVLAINVALLGNVAAYAVDMKAGDWTVSVGGIANASYTQISCSGGSVGGLALADRALGCGGKNNRATIGNGSLPSGLITMVQSRQGEFIACIERCEARRGPDQPGHQRPDQRRLRLGFDTAASGPAQHDAGWFQNWASGKTQQFESNDAAHPSVIWRGVEIGGSYAAGPFAILGNYQTSKGLGMLSDDDQSNSRSSNYFLQGSYKATDQAKLAVNFGQSKNKNKENTAAAGGPESHANVAAGVYYLLTPSITLVGELGQTGSKGFAGTNSRLNGGSFSGIFFLQLIDAGWRHAEIRRAVGLPFRARSILGDRRESITFSQLPMEVL